jgi:hypothetical protein
MFDYNLFNTIIDAEDLDYKEKGILLIIARFHNSEKGYSYPSIKKIKSLALITDDRTVYSIINSLIEKKWLTKETLKGVGNKYFITVPTKITDGAKITVPTLFTETPTVNNVGGVPTKITEQNNKENYKKKNIYITFDFEEIDHIKLTQEQYDKLIDKHGKNAINKLICDMDNYEAQRNKKYKDYYKALNTWSNRQNEKFSKPQNVQVPVIPEGIGSRKKLG